MQNDSDLPLPPRKGAVFPLEITPKAKQRLLCGLRWNPKTKQESGLDNLLGALTGTGNKQSYDLDLMCVVYDRAGDFLDGVSGGLEDLVDSSGKIYHSGDDTEGFSEHDDEQIYVETLDLPEKIHSIVFIAEIQSAHTFGTVAEPSIRLADSYDDRTFISVPLQQPDGMDKTAFVFACARRDGPGWNAHYIGAYFNSRDVADWSETCKAFLK